MGAGDVSTGTGRAEVGISLLKNTEAGTMQGEKAETGRKCQHQNRKKNGRDSSSGRRPKPMGERDALDQGFLPESGLDQHRT